MKIYLFEVRCWEHGTNRNVWTVMCVAVGIDPVEAYSAVWRKYKRYIGKKQGLSVTHCNDRGVRMPSVAKVIISGRITPYNSHR